MMKLFIFVTLLLWLRPSNVFASATTVRGGGSGVACPNRSVEVLDLFELRREWPVKFDSIDAGFDVQFSSTLRDRLLRSGLSTSLVEQIVSRYVQLETAVHLDAGLDSEIKIFTTNFSLTSDVGQTTVLIPEECRLVQIGVVMRTFSGLNWNLNRSIYASMSNADRVAFLVHETLQDYFNLPVTTERIREAVRFIFSDVSTRTLTKKDFVSLFERTD